MLVERQHWSSGSTGRAAALFWQRHLFATGLCLI
jgi:hypothetical protein